MRTKTGLNTALIGIVVALVITVVAAAGSTAPMLGSAPAIGSTRHDSQTRLGTDSSFLRGIHRAGIIAPDQEAVETANEVARMDSSNAGADDMARVIRNFGVYDEHVDAFEAAATAAYGSYGQDAAFLQGIHRAGIIAPDQEAVETANEVARMDSSNASADDMARVIRNFGVYDEHVDAFEAAAIAAYEI
ncbi:hypothetical protein GCM10023191_001560 [Actinoallomurus oryzae]|uniref:DUF732 domain-containing protein n=1 Tax=Actinoallomurus oryzae TaxID=502180 RepID=A0ABP8P7X9_9ACTN